MTDSKRIAKNSVFLYFRMFLTMGVSLYTSRVVLDVLGIDDFGIYSIVGGVVALFAFFNSAMSAATQRYLAFDIGKNDTGKLQKTFNSTFIIHILIAVLILIFAETVGLWYINNRLNVSSDRITAVNWVYQFSILTSLLGVMQVPFNALIIARERMNVFAFMSILDVGLKLGAVYLLYIIGYDKLILHSILICFVTLTIAIFYRLYCYKHFSESKFSLYKDIVYYKELISYSGWNLFGNIAAVAKGQGINLVLNVFFGTLVNAAYGITLQVQGAVTVFVNSFQIAVNPQIIKTYSQGNVKGTNKLVLQSTKFSFFLMLIIATPILMNTEYLLNLWLKTPPPHTVIFVRLCLINVLIDCISGPMMTGAQATGNIKWYQIIIGSLIFFNLPLSYFVLKITGEAYFVMLVSIFITIITLCVRILFLRNMIQLSLSEFVRVVFYRIGLVSCFVCLIAAFFIKCGFVNGFVEFVLSGLIATTVVFIFGLSRDDKNFVIKIIKR